VLPQRGHFIVHICVKGPSGVTVKISNVGFTVASFNRFLISIRRDAVQFAGISGSTTPMSKSAQQNQSVEASRGVASNSERTSRYQVIFPATLPICRTRTKETQKNLFHSLATFAQILAGNIVLRHLMCANFPLVSVPGVFHALHHLGLERVSFFEQLVYTFGIRTLDVG
jgi:hypothetical protein